MRRRTQKVEESIFDSSLLVVSPPEECNSIEIKPSNAMLLVMMFVSLVSLGTFPHTVRG